MQKSNDSPIVGRHWQCPYLGTLVRETKVRKGENDQRQEFRILALFLPTIIAQNVCIQVVIIHSRHDSGIEGTLCSVMILANLLSGIWEYLDLPEG